MKYLSSNEIAEIWKITPTRVIALARKGKIAGAQRIANRWMIPSDSLKPSDGRTKQIKNNKTPYRFPITIFGNYTNEEIQNFSKEEKDLYKAFVLYCNYELQETEKILSNLLESTENLYIKTGTLYLLCYTCWHKGNLDKTFTHLFNLRKIFEDTFPHKEENRFILIDVLSVFFGTKVFEDAVKTDFKEKHSEQSRVFFTVMTICKDLLSLIKRKSIPNIDLCELVCSKLESDNYFLSAMYIHCYLGGMYTVTNNPENSSFHYEKAVDLAVKHKYYVPFIEITFSSYNMFKQAINRQSQEEQNKLNQLHNLISKDFIAIAEWFGTKSIANKNLTDEDYRFINYVICDIPNKQISRLENIAESTVNKKFLSIYEKLGISGKKELFNLSIVSLVDKEAVKSRS